METNEAGPSSGAPLGIGRSRRREIGAETSQANGRLKRTAGERRFATLTRRRIVQRQRDIAERVEVAAAAQKLESRTYGSHQQKIAVARLRSRTILRPAIQRDGDLGNGAGFAGDRNLRWIRAALLRGAEAT